MKSSIQKRKRPSTDGVKDEDHTVRERKPVSLCKTPTKRQKIKSKTDYSKCVICRGNSLKGLNNVTSKETFAKAMKYRQDSVAECLKYDITSDIWMEDNSPKWHSKCRNTYNQVKLYKIAAKKNEENQFNHCKVEYIDHAVCRRAFPKRDSGLNCSVDPKTMCFVCGSDRYQGKYPNSKVTVPKIKTKVLKKAKEIDHQGIVMRLESGCGIDLVSNDICYHRICMNRFRASRALNEPKPTAYEEAFDMLVSHLDELFFEEKKGLLMKDINDLFNNFLSEICEEDSARYQSWKQQQKLVIMGIVSLCCNKLMDQHSCVHHPSI